MLYDISHPFPLKKSTDSTWPISTWRPCSVHTVKDRPPQRYLTGTFRLPNSCRVFDIKGCTATFDSPVLMEQFRNPYIVLMGKPEGKRPLGWPRRRWEVNTKMDLRWVVMLDTG